MKEKTSILISLGLLALKGLAEYRASKNKKKVLNDYLDKKVVRVRIDEIDRGVGERIKLDNVVLHKSIIKNSEIELDKLNVIGDDVTFNNNIFKQNNTQYE